jgi:hypothetical protein
MGGYRSSFLSPNPAELSPDDYVIAAATLLYFVPSYGLSTINRVSADVAAYAPKQTQLRTCAKKNASRLNAILDTSRMRHKKGWLIHGMERKKETGRPSNPAEPAVSESIARMDMNQPPSPTWD